VEPHFKILINGQTVAHLKRMKHGEPAITWGPPQSYTERVAKGWLKTCSKYFWNVTMEPV
jgi:hypothetical protein